eukprot:TRINITY_DN58810_c0_g1_i1.p1 TRINITY_DN58810_c0_g1~~TRINITY_DN58810_c0_g1_i1.p1  ORF type:complete len:313 (+),score=34.12 TRINITY_DN58810_c0_g1_i1:45-941(+)
MSVHNMSGSVDVEKEVHTASDPFQGASAESTCSDEHSSSSRSVADADQDGGCCADDPFWCEPGHFVIPSCITHEERTWLRALNASHGRTVGHRPCATSRDGEEDPDGTAFLGDTDRARLRSICFRVATAVSQYEGQAQFLDLAILSRTALGGHRPHVDNERLERRADGTVEWVPGASGHRSWSVSVMLSEPWEYEGGELVFYRAQKNGGPRISLKPPAGSAVAFRGDRHHPHGVNPVAGDRLVLVIFLRNDPVSPAVPRLYKRSGTGRAVFLEPSLKTVTAGVCMAAWSAAVRAGTRT